MKTRYVVRSFMQSDRIRYGVYDIMHNGWVSGSSVRNHQEAIEHVEYWENQRATVHDETVWLCDDLITGPNSRQVPLGD